MFRRAIYVAAALGVAGPPSVMAHAAAAPVETAIADPLPRMTVDQALAAEHRPLARRVLEMLKVMEETVAAGKKPGFDERGWARYGAYFDTAHFRRVDIFGSSVNWPQYVQTLTSWARTYWYTGYVRRINEVGNLVYVENIERSSRRSPTGDDDAFHSIAVYRFGADGRIDDVEIYAEMPQSPAK